MCVCVRLCVRGGHGRVSRSDLTRGHSLSLTHSAVYHSFCCKFDVCLCVREREAHWEDPIWHPTQHTRVTNFDSHSLFRAEKAAAGAGTCFQLHAWRLSDWLRHWGLCLSCVCVCVRFLSIEATDSWDNSLFVCCRWCRWPASTLPRRRLLACLCCRTVRDSFIVLVFAAML